MIVPKMMQIYYYFFLIILEHFRYFQPIYPSRYSINFANLSIHIGQTSFHRKDPLLYIINPL